MDTASFLLTLQSAEGTPAVEPNATVRFAKADATSVGLAPHVAFPPSTRSFLIPAWPAVDNLFCDLSLSRYRPQKSGFFTPEADLPTAATVVVMRDPSQWTPAFDPLANVTSAQFADFRRIVNQSTNVDIKNGATIGNLKTNFDALSGEQAILAKMCVLNLYAVLHEELNPTAGGSWIGGIRRIVRIDRERFVAEVDQTIYTSVREILDNLDTYRNLGFFPELSPAQHRENFPDRYVLNDLISVKVRYQQGNLQITPAAATLNGQPVYLVDCDLDEHSNLMLHTGDMFSHVFTGGTHPIDMHEYIVAHSAEQNTSGHTSTIELGYALSAKN